MASKLKVGKAATGCRDGTGERPADRASEISSAGGSGPVPFGTDPKRFPRIPPQTLHACFKAISRHGLIAGVHNKNDEMVRAAIQAVETSGIRDYRAHAMSRPPATETLAMAEVYELAADAGCRASGNRLRRRGERSR